MPPDEAIDKAAHLPPLRAIAVYKTVLAKTPTEKKVIDALHGMYALIKTEKRPDVKGGPARPAGGEGKKDALLLLASLSQEEFNYFVDKIQQPRIYPPGTMIITEGERSTYSLCLVSRGRVKIFVKKKREEKTLAEVGENEFFGEVSFFTKGLRSASVATLQETEILEVGEEDLREMTEKFPHIEKILKEFSQKRAMGVLDTFLE